jgi:ubiquinone/menaquinone biosynthesis C-methylase UbiE
MPEPIDPRGRDNPSNYFVQDKGSEAELIRLMIQDDFVTVGMGGPLPEQSDPASFHRVLDVGCGPGGWILDLARIYPQMNLTGIDISWKMIEYARAEAQARRLTDGVEFLVMDALRPLEFPDDSFDLVNMRLVTSWMLAKDWPGVLRELLRVTRPHGIVRVTDAETLMQSNSPAHMRLGQMVHCALSKSGHLFTEESVGTTRILPQLLAESGCQQVQSQPHTLEFVAGTIGGQNFYENVKFGYQTLLPFLQKWGCASEDYDALYEQALIELQQPDLRATWYRVTAWGSKPDTPA